MKYVCACIYRSYFVKWLISTILSHKVCTYGCMQALRVGVKGQPDILNGTLPAAVHPDECTWLLEDGKTIVITLDKVQIMPLYSLFAVLQCV